MKIKEKKKAISLIVLVITIIVLSILAATVIISISNTNVIEEANNTVFKADMSNYKEVYEMYVTEKTLKDISFDRSTLNLKNGDQEFNEIFGEVLEKYQEGLAIEDGRIVYETADNSKKEILVDLDMCPAEVISKDTSYVGYYADTDGDGTVDGFIYADLAFSGGTSFNVWEWTGRSATTYTEDYSYNAVDHAELKDYVISGEFGTKAVIKVKNGNDNENREKRFYVMAFEDYEENGVSKWEARSAYSLSFPAGWSYTSVASWAYYMANKTYITESPSNSYVCESNSLFFPSACIKENVSYDILRYNFSSGWGGGIRLSTTF